jgi:hypothetical protein
MVTDGDHGIPPPGGAGLSRLVDGNRLSYPNPTRDLDAFGWP